MSKDLAARVFAILTGGVPTSTSPCLIAFAVDPTGAGVAAPVGSIGSRTDVPSFYQKTGVANTAWSLLAIVTANTALPGQVTLGGIITPPSLAANQNDYNPAGLAGASVLRQDISTAVTITGLAAQPAGTLLCFQNVSVAFEPITISNESGLSVVANRFNLPGGAAWYIPFRGAITFIYDGTLSRWMIFSIGGNAFPSINSQGGPGLTVGFPNENVGLVRTATNILGLMAAASSRVTVSGDGADPNPFSYIANTRFDALGQMRLNATEAIGPLAGTVNNQAVASSSLTLRITTSALTSITGMTGGAAGRRVTIVNAGPDAIAILNSDGGSVAANQFLLPASISIPAEGVAQFWYDGVSSRWRLWSGS